MKKRTIIMILPLLLVSCGQEKRELTNKEIKEVSTDIATSIVTYENTSRFQVEAETKTYNRDLSINVSKTIEKINYETREAYLFFEDTVGTTTSSVEVYYSHIGDTFYIINTTDKYYCAVDLVKYSSYSSLTGFPNSIFTEYQKSYENEMFLYVKMLNTYLPDVESENKEEDPHYALAKEDKNGNMDVEFHMRTINSEADQQLFEVKVKKEIVIKIATSSYRYTNVSYESNQSDRAIINEQKNFAFKYNNEVKFNLPDYSSFEDKTESHLKSVGINVE